MELIRAQLKRADKLGARAAIVLGDNELARQAAAVKDLAPARATALPSPFSGRAWIVEARALKAADAASANNRVPHGDFVLKAVITQR